MAECGINTNIDSLQGNITSLTDSLTAAATDASKGIGASITTLSATLTAGMDTITTDIQGMIPAIPEIPTNLQTEMTALLDISVLDPIALSTQVQYINDTFGDSVDSLGEVLGDALDAYGSGAAFDVCTLVPNVDISADGTSLTKGAVGTLAEVDVIVELDPPTPLTLAEVQPQVTTPTVAVTETVTAALTPIIPQDAIGANTWINYWMDSKEITIKGVKQTFYYRRLVIPGIESNSGGVIHSWDFYTMTVIALKNKKGWIDEVIDLYHQQMVLMAANTDYKVHLNYFSGTYNKDAIRESVGDIINNVKNSDRTQDISWETNVDWSSISQKVT